MTKQTEKDHAKEKEKTNRQGVTSGPDKDLACNKNNVKEKGKSFARRAGAQNSGQRERSIRSNCRKKLRGKGSCRDQLRQ